MANLRESESRTTSVPAEKFRVEARSSTASRSSGFLIAAFALALLPAPSLAQGSLVGVVVSGRGDRSLANAEILILDLDRSTRSDSAGAFRLTRVPAGRHQIVVRLAGYEPWKGALVFRDTVTVEADFVLEVVPAVLPVVDVRAAPARLNEFEERRKAGAGQFLTADAFENAGGRNLSDILLSRIPGLKTYGNASERYLSSTRGVGRCPIQIVVNGTAVFWGQADQPRFHIDGVLPEDVIGFEYYTIAQIPARYAGTGGRSKIDNAPQGAVCGTAVIWTK